MAKKEDKIKVLERRIKVLEDMQPLIIHIPLPSVPPRFSPSPSLPIPFPPFPSPTPTTNPNLHYHNGSPCYNNPCIWCGN